MKPCVSRRPELCAERDALQEHNERLRTRIEAMVVRIKGLE